jgi:hypothetical protein
MIRAVVGVIGIVLPVVFIIGEVFGTAQTSVESFG